LPDKNSPIGIFDSGMGGVSVLAEAIRQLPNEKFIYVGDSKNAPYGVKSIDELRKLSFDICDMLVERGVKAIVVACNTATSAAVNELRGRYEIPVIGMEPALKPAVIQNMGKNVAVLATEVTLREEKFAKLTDKFRESANIISIPSPSLVTLVESGTLEGEYAESEIRRVFKYLDPKGLSAVVLGCTHFVFLKNTIRKVLGKKVGIYHGNVGTVRQLRRLIMETGMLCCDNADRMSPIQVSSSLENLVIINTLSDDMVDLSRELALYYLTNIEDDDVDKREDESSSDNLKEEVERYLFEIIESSHLSESEEKLLRFRYGIENVNRASFEELMKLMGIRKPELLKKAISSLDRKLFNYIKNKVI
jgi:glutamate racemase